MKKTAADPASAFSARTLLHQLPVQQGRSGWPWTTEVNPHIYSHRSSWPKISIVTPSYQQGAFIEETIRSILLQNYPNLEYIVIDGGSTDSSVDLIKSYEPWLTYWVSEKDQGQAQAINKGFKQSSGDIINWINSDDLLVEKALYQVAESFMNADSKVAFIYGQCIHFNHEGDLPIDYQPKDLLPLRYYYSFPYAQPSSFYKREVLLEVGLLDESFDFAMDFDFFIRIALRYRMQQIPQVLSRFRRHGASKTTRLRQLNKQESLLIFNTLLTSLGAEVQIAVLRSLDLAVLPHKKYLISYTFTRKEIDFITAAFLYPYVAEWYDSGNFNKAKLALKGLHQLGGKALLKETSLFRMYCRLKYLGGGLIAKLRQINLYLAGLTQGF